MQSRHLIRAAFALAVFCLPASTLWAGDDPGSDDQIPPPKPKVVPEPIQSPAASNTQQPPPALPSANNPAPKAADAPATDGAPIGDGCGDSCCGKKCHFGWFKRIFCCRPHFFHCHKCRSHCFAFGHLFHGKHGCCGGDGGGYATVNGPFAADYGAYAYGWNGLIGQQYAWNYPVYQSFAPYTQNYQPAVPYYAANRPVARTVPTLSLVSRLCERASATEVARLSGTATPEILVGNGISDFFDGKHGAALANFDASLSKDDKNALAWYGKALTERALGDDDAALTALRRADKLSREQGAEAKLNGLIERLPTADRQWLRETRKP